MEADPLPSHPSFNLPTRTGSNSSLKRLPRRELSTRSQRSAKAGHGLREPRFRRSPPRPLGTEAEPAAKLKARLSPIRAGKPLVPVGERRSGEDAKHSKARREGDSEKWDITPDGSSAGREGRQFTVANVGNNGKIYLRPTVRPANQRYPQPNFVFPITPPSTAGLDALTSSKGTGQDYSELHCNTELTPWTTPSIPDVSKWMRPHESKVPPIRSSQHRRAVSDSTVQDISIAHESDADAFKVVISKPKDEPRSRTTEDISPSGAPLLQVAIPSWRLGNPRFTIRGSPIIRGSSYAPTEDVRSDQCSFFNKSHVNSLHNSLHPETSNVTRNSPVMSSHINFPSPQLLSPSSARFPAHTRATNLTTHIFVEPAMFDALTFKPACDDRSVVRYSSATGAVTAATPPRLVAEITSPSFLDYELLSDFFLTFRTFLEAADLLRMLIARLKWSLLRDDEAGMIVRVRTFVAIRHWILNYFVDDFVVDYHLRVTFCNLLNDFVEELSEAPRGRKVQLKILSELKKCWRRVCAQYWDGPEFDCNLGPESPIAPGGIAGHRNPSLDPSFWEAESYEPPHLGLDFPVSDPRVETTFYMDVDNAGHIDTVFPGGERPSTPPRRSETFSRQPDSPTSIASLDVVSCSFPTKQFRMADPAANYSLATHPVDPSSIYTNTDPIAPTPRALTGKRVRPQPAHKHNNSLSDSLRDHATETEKVLYKNAEFLLTLPYAGSLVRGNLMPPGQAFVDVAPPSSAGANRQTTVFQPHPPEVQKEKIASAMSGAGMRKLLGGVRKALSNKGSVAPSTQGSYFNIAPIGPRGVTENRLPGTAIVPQARPQRPNGFKPAVRIDVLGAEIAEDFKKAVRGDASAEASGNDVPTKVTVENIEYSAAHLDSSFDLQPPPGLRPFSDAQITEGSKSIVIVDDTFPEDFPAMSGALPALNSNTSVETFEDGFIPTAADPTPPNTPPSQRETGDTPRRSSYIFSQHMLSPSLSEKPLPPFVPDLATLGADGASDDPDTSLRTSVVRRSNEYSKQSPNGPPLSGVRHHMRQQSSRSYLSHKSVAKRRWASFQSAKQHATVRSFDATTYSEGASCTSEIMPPPLRVLRRRPGGDLKGVQHVTELDAMPLHRSRSVGSLTTYSESIRSSYLQSPLRESSARCVGIVSSDYYQNHREVSSLGALAEKPAQRRLSLFSTHSSKPVMRPSFEVEAQKLAQIPDDVDDDGGIESALAKLEGKWPPRQAKLPVTPKITQAPVADVPADIVDEPVLEHTTPEKEKRKHRHQHVDVDIIHPRQRNEGQLPMTLKDPYSSEVKSFLPNGSRDSYSSIPLLKRGLTDDGRSKTNTIWTNHSILQDPESPTDEIPGSSSPALPSFEMVSKRGSMEKIPPGESAPRTSEIQSFLDDGSDNDDSDLSSEISMELVHSGDLPMDLRSAKRPVSIMTEIPPNLDIEAHQSSQGDPTSPISMAQASQLSPEAVQVPQLHEHQVWGQKSLPPTPDTTPTTAIYHTSLNSPEDPTGARETLRDAPKLEGESSQRFSVHLPFILAFESEILAQQFTLIEKDALNEVDWKELIDMRWKNTYSDSRSWVDFLRNSDARGVEVVVARFNIMVKWTISEIVLTQELEERARCIIKFLHIAAHCRKYRNFATMSQIAIALTSNEVARLTKTWAMVPDYDLRTMQELETLVSPTKNFYNLRAEMEGGAAAAENGCIPFVGIYTHDLLFNSQRPSEIASSPTTAPLINFERCRIASAVVKTLLRLLEASTLYQFQPIEGITERCLWMSALSDNEIRRHSESLEPSPV